MNGKDGNAREVYADIIGLPHWDPSARPRMDLRERAAQFAPYAALVGFDDMVREEERETETWTEPGEDGAEMLSRSLAALSEKLAGGIRPVCSVTYFIPDGKKSGGRIVTAEVKVKRIDPVLRRIVIAKEGMNAGTREEIGFDRLVQIEEVLSADRPAE